MWRNTDCRIVSELLWNYTAHRLSEPEIERVERHLGLCGSCRAEAAAYRQTVDALASAQRSPIPESRRGWRELQMRLSESPAAQQSANRWRWGIPPLVWGATAAAAVLCFAVWTHPFEARNNAVPGSTASGESASSVDVAQTAPDMPADSWDDMDYTYIAPDTRVEPNTSRHGSINNGTGIAMAAGAHRLPRSSFRWARTADARNGVRVIAMGHPRTRRGPIPDYAHMDGRHAANSTDSPDYVLTPVSATSDSDSAADYVMGSIVMTGRFSGTGSSSDDTEEARGW
jgi:hypothetical protein